MIAYLKYAFIWSLRFAGGAFIPHAGLRNYHCLPLLEKKRKQKNQGCDEIAKNFNS